MEVASVLTGSTSYELVAAPGAGSKIRVNAIEVSSNTEGTHQFLSASTLKRPYIIGQYSGFEKEFSPTKFECAENEALNYTPPSAAAAVAMYLDYDIVPV